jgi:ribosomal protein S18 acetylase RimI-like enzyme
VVTVRRAEAHDADSVLALMEELGRPAVAGDASTQREVFVAHLERDDAVVFVAESDGRIVGAASFWVRPRLNWTSPEAWIPDLIVSSPHRRRGAARRLLDACAAEARARGCHVLRLESGPQRAAAHRLYEAYGSRRRLGGADLQDVQALPARPSAMTGRAAWVSWKRLRSDFARAYELRL